MKIRINEHLVEDYLYEQVKNDPVFERLGLDQQGELIVSVVNQVDLIMADFFPPIQFDF